MLGGPLPEGADGPTVWYECVHPDDRADAGRLLRAARDAASRPRPPIACAGSTASSAGSGRAPCRTPVTARVAYDAVITDVTERERARIGLQLAREEAERRSRVDPTTGLFNRHHLLDVARRELARAAARAHQPGARAARRRPPARAQRAARARGRRRRAARARRPALAQRAHLRHDLPRRRRPASPCSCPICATARRCAASATRSPRR